VDKPLAGRTIAIPETRELNVLAAMIEEKGATAIRCPLVGIHDAPDPVPIVAWLRELVAGTFDDLILLTGEGLRRLLGFARRAEMFNDVVSAVGRVRKITRGPKPARALREIGLAPDLAAEQPTTDGVIATLSRVEMRGRAVGVQLYAQVPNPRLVEFLSNAGATVHPVAPYVYAPASDADRVVDLIGRLERGEVDCIAFTSASQAERLWAVAEARGLQSALASGIARTRVAAVGPVVAEELRRHGAEVHVMPKSSFFMRPMINEIVTELTGTGK
jgi:uroporphyrinogen-III synthase